MYFGPALRSAQQYQLPSNYPPTPPESAGQTDVSGIVSTLLRRRRIFFATLIGFLALVVLWTAVVPKQYTATTKLIAGASSQSAPHEGDTTLPVLNAILAADSTMTAETYVDLIQEDPVVHQVIQNLSLHISAAKLLSKYINVQPVTNTAIIQLAATWSDPHTAINIANEFANVFVNRERELIAGQAASALDYLSTQMPIAEAAMRKADDALVKFQSAHPDIYIAAANTTGGDTSSATNSVSAAEQRYAQVKVDKEQAQAQLNSVLGQMAATSPTSNGQSNVVQNPVTSQLQNQLAQVQVQLDVAHKQYTEQYPGVQALEQQKAQLLKEIQSQPQRIVAGNDIVPNPVYQQLSQQAASLRSQIAGDEAQLNMLGIEMGRSSSNGSSVPAETVQLANLQRDATMAEATYSALQQKYTEATVERTTALSDVSITQPASMYSLSVKPNWLTNLILGLALGLVLAISAVFVVEFFDNTFKDEQDVQRALPLPVLTAVPQLGGANSQKRLPWLRALTVESFLQLVTALRYSSDKPLRTLAITSPHQGDGKTTVAMSTAIAMAEIEPKIILVDCDLRRPTLHKRMGMNAGPGLSDVLVGEITAKDAVQATKYDGLYMLSGGTLVPNPVKLIHSARFDELIAELLKTYRAVVFDTPALLPVYDAAVLASKVDGCVLVISANSTDMPSTKKALQRLGATQGVNLIGAVLNRATPTNGYAAYYLNTDNPTPLPHENGVASPS